MVINSGTGLIEWTPTNAQSEGTHTVSVKVTDSENATDSQTFNITNKWLQNELCSRMIFPIIG